MTLEALSHKTGRRRKQDDASGALPIGEIDSNIFNCPACARPLGVGTSRCPGCATRLVAGVQAGRAIAFVAVGLGHRAAGRWWRHGRHGRPDPGRAGRRRRWRDDRPADGRPAADRGTDHHARAGRRTAHPHRRPVGPAPDGPRQPAPGHLGRAAGDRPGRRRPVVRRHRPDPALDVDQRHIRPAHRRRHRRRGTRGTTLAADLDAFYAAIRVDGQRRPRRVPPERGRLRGRRAAACSASSAAWPAWTPPPGPWPPRPTSSCRSSTCPARRRRRSAP